MDAERLQGHLLAVRGSLDRQREIRKELARPEGSPALAYDERAPLRRLAWSWATPHPPSVPMKIWQMAL
jgi:hypothetical protein